MPDIVCPTCGGHKKLVEVSQDSEGNDVIVKIVCPTCEGKGKVTLDRETA